MLTVDEFYGRGPVRVVELRWRGGKVKFTGLAQNSQVSPPVWLKIRRADPDSGSTLWISGWGRGGGRRRRLGRGAAEEEEAEKEEEKQADGSVTLSPSRVVFARVCKSSVN